MAERTHIRVKGLVFVGVGNYAVKKNAKMRPGVVRNFIVRRAKRNFPIRIGDDILRPLVPEPDKIRWRNVTETSRNSGADTFKSRRRPAIVEIFRNHRHHQAQVSARRTARDINPVGINVKTLCVLADEADGVAAIADILRKTALLAETVFDGENGEFPPHEKLPA